MIDSEVEAKRQKTGGRQAGTPNKLTKSAKEAFQHAFDEMGGAEGLTTWGRTHRSDFYKIYSRLIPIDTTLSSASDLSISVRYVAPCPK